MDGQNIDMNNKIKVTKIYITKGQYEGYDYYKLIAETDKGFKLTSKLTKFEFDVLSK